MPVGLILLVGAPAAGKSAFARAWLECGQIDADGVVSCDAIRTRLFGARVDVGDDPAVFDELDRRVAARLMAARAVVVDATNVTSPARRRMLAWAQRHGRPTTALRFPVDEELLVRRNATRLGPARVPTEDVLRYAAVAAQHTSGAQLRGEGIDIIIDVPGEAEGVRPSEAAAMIHLRS